MTAERSFPGFCKIHLEDRAVFTEYLKRMLFPPQLITYTFGNFYLWRHWDQFCWQIREDALCILAQSPFGLSALPPLASGIESFIQAVDYLTEEFHRQQQPILFTELDSRLCALIQKTWPGRFLAEEYRPGSNYIYRQEDLAGLKGKKYDGKRNHLNSFFRNTPDWQLCPLNKELAEPCKTLFRSWNALLHPDEPELQLEALGIEQALEHLPELQLSGAVLLSRGKPIAFTFGEELNANTFCIHVEKADSRIRGAYQAINKLFAAEYCQTYTYINRAEDMGNPGQRKAKESYHPCCLERKYILRERNEHSLCPPK